MSFQCWRIEPRALCVSDKSCTTEQHPQSSLNRWSSRGDVKDPAPGRRGLSDLAAAIEGTRGVFLLFVYLFSILLYILFYIYLFILVHVTPREKTILPKQWERHPGAV